MNAKPTTIDDYLATVPDDRRAALQKLREAIRALQPNAEECISYNMPAFRLDGTVFAGFLATAKGCSYYPFSGSTLKTLAADVAGYAGSMGSLHFAPAKGLPTPLLKKLIATRLAEAAAKKPAAKKPAAKKPSVKKAPARKAAAKKR